MAYRCAEARVSGKGRLEGYRLIFQASFANVERLAGSVVPVLLWEISKQDERNLDRYEGFPLLYRKAIVKVRQDDGSVADALTYVMTGLRQQRLMPTRQYLQTVMDGYCDAGFDLSFIRQALELLAESNRCNTTAADV